MKTALIIGASGQDGSYLSEYLLSLGYQVFGVIRRSTRVPRFIIPGVTYLTGDVLDGSSILAALRESDPDEVYNLAAHAFVGDSWTHPHEQAEITGLGCVRVLEAIRQYNSIFSDEIRFYQASTSEMFGNAPAPQNEQTLFKPSSPYGCAKLYAHSMTVNYRESYGMYACCGILFNHESERRTIDFVTQRIVTQSAEILAGKRDFIELGTLEARRDWGYAPEYVKAMHLMLQQEKPSDYVVATGQTHSVGEFLAIVLDLAGLDMKCVTTGNNLRPLEAWELRGDASRIRALGWEPTVGVEKLARIMFEAAKERQCVSV